MSDVERIRLVILGGAGVGKSCIVKRFLFKTYNDKYRATVEDLYNREYDLGAVSLKVRVRDHYYRVVLTPSIIKATVQKKTFLFKQLFRIFCALDLFESYFFLVSKLLQSFYENYKKYVCEL